jgi:hypothetical protein
MSDIVFGSFIWDEEKEQSNWERHGIAFREAVLAFHDPRRLIAVDRLHSQHEPRFFCVGRVGERIATVRFTFRGDFIRIIGAGYWRKGARLYETRQTDR